MAADDSPLIGKVEIVNAPSEPSLNVTASVTVPGTVEVTQGTVPWDVGQDPGSDPWIVGGTVAATQSGSWTVAATQSGSWSVTVSGTVAVTQSGSWTVAATQSGSWTVAITGSVTVTGTVAATQSGSWTVAATQSGSWSVTVSGTVAATQSGSWTVTADQGGSWTVSISGTVAVTQSGSWTVAATQSGTWSVTVSGTVAATQSGSWTVAATQSGSWTASVTQSTSPWVTQDKSSSATGSAVPATAMAGGLEGGDGHLHTAQGDTNGNAYVLPIAGTLNANLLLVTGGAAQQILPTPATGKSYRLHSVNMNGATTWQRLTGNVSGSVYSILTGSNGSMQMLEGMIATERINAQVGTSTDTPRVTIFYDLIDTPTIGP